MSEQSTETGGVALSVVSIPLICTGNKTQVPYFRYPAFNDYKVALKLKVPQSMYSSLPHPTQGKVTVGSKQLQTSVDVGAGEVPRFPLTSA